MMLLSAVGLGCRVASAASLLGPSRALDQDDLGPFIAENKPDQALSQVHICYFFIEQVTTAAASHRKRDAAKLVQ